MGIGQRVHVAQIGTCPEPADGQKGRGKAAAHDVDGQKVAIARHLPEAAQALPDTLHHMPVQAAAGIRRITNEEVNGGAERQRHNRQGGKGGGEADLPQGERQRRRREQRTDSAGHADDRGRHRGHPICRYPGDSEQVNAGDHRTVSEPDESSTQGHAGNAGGKGEQDEAGDRDQVHGAQHHPRAVPVVENARRQLNHGRGQKHAAHDGTDLRRPVAARAHEFRGHDRATAAVDLHESQVQAHEQHDAVKTGHRARS